MVQCAGAGTCCSGRYVTWSVVAVWSAVNVAGTRLRDIAPNVGTDADTENWQKVHKDVINRCVRVCVCACVCDVTTGIMLRSIGLVNS